MLIEIVRLKYALCASTVSPSPVWLRVFFCIFILFEYLLSLDERQQIDTFAVAKRRILNRNKRQKDTNSSKKPKQTDARCWEAKQWQKRKTTQTKCKKTKKRKLSQTENKTAESYKLNGKLSIFKWHVTVRIEAVDTNTKWLQTRQASKCMCVYISDAIRDGIHWARHYRKLTRIEAIWYTKCKETIIYSIHVL